MLRDRQWFLSGFWAKPSVRLQGIGGPLLREVVDEGRRRGAETFYVWASIDEAALAAYMKVGMLPGTQLMTFQGEPTTLPAPSAGYASVPFAHDAIAALDRGLVGVDRRIDHDYWGERGFEQRVVTKDGRAVGYYAIVNGLVGPAGWTTDADGESVLALALRDARSLQPAVSMTIPGLNHVALRVALASGLRLIRMSHLLWTSPIGDMTRYVPSGPMLF